MVVARVQAFIGDFADGLQQFLPCRERAPCRFVVSGFIELHERVPGVQVSAKNHHGSPACKASTRLIILSSLWEFPASVSNIKPNRQLCQNLRRLASCICLPSVSSLAFSPAVLTCMPEPAFTHV